jgi:hypothetical protein
MDRLDRTLEHFVDDGRMSVTLAEEVSRDFHTHHVDIRGRLAELAGYAGAGLAVLGVVLIGSQVWTDIGQILRAGIPAVVCAGLLLGAWTVVHGIDTAAYPVRARLAQVMGVCSAIMGALTVMVAFPMPDDGVDQPWQPTVALGVALLISFAVSRWVPGFISTLGVGIALFGFGLAAMMQLPIDQPGPGPFGLYMVVLGAVAALLLQKYFPPPWLTQLMGLYAWLQGTLMLLLANEEYEAMQHPQPFWVWFGRISAVVLVGLGTWIFARGGDWPWAIGAALAAAMLVGFWSAQALNAGIALLVAGFVLIAVGLGLAGGRKVLHRPRTPSQPAKMGS